MRKLTKTQQSGRERYANDLRAALPPGTKVYTILRHVSKSGMMREVSLHRPAALANGGLTIAGMTYKVSEVLGWPIGKHYGIKLGGAGMDMGYHLVYSLGSVLYPHGFECVGDGCPSNDHSNGDRDYSPHQHRDGGYALRQEWL